MLQEHVTDFDPKAEESKPHLHKSFILR